MAKELVCECGKVLGALKPGTLFCECGNRYEIRLSDKTLTKLVGKPDVGLLLEKPDDLR
jgi:hypothetical protein